MFFPGRAYNMVLHLAPDVTRRIGGEQGSNQRHNKVFNPCLIKAGMGYQSGVISTISFKFSERIENFCLNSSLKTQGYKMTSRVQLKRWPTAYSL